MQTFKLRQNFEKKFLGVSEVKQIFAPHFSISINFLNEEFKNSQRYEKFLSVYRQKMALHLVLICPALLAAQDSLGRLVGNKLPLLLLLGDVLKASWVFKVAQMFANQVILDKDTLTDPFKGRIRKA